MAAEQPLVEMTITSCRRLDYFITTMTSFYESMADAHLLSRITCCDDHSSDEDRAEMRRRFPDIEFLWSPVRGHAHSLRTLFGRLRARYVLHWEDDFVLAGPLAYIARCRSILERHEDVTSVILTHVHGQRHRDEYGDYFIKLFDRRVAAACPTRGCGFNRRYGQPKNPGFSLNPGLHETRAIQSIPWPVCKQHEYAFARAYQRAGHRVAYLDKTYARHIGAVSSYTLNKTER